MKLYPNRRLGGFTLVEQMVSLTCGLIVLAAVLTAGVALQRSFAAVEGYSMAEGDQLRVQDYIAMDCRRAVSGKVEENPEVDADGNVLKDAAGNVLKTWTLTLDIPTYYDANTNNPVDPTHPPDGSIQYGADRISISYYRSGTRFIRKVNRVENAIATNVDSFTVTPQDLTSSVTCSITFAPRFTILRNSGPINGTTVFSNTFLRNAAARQ